MSLKSVLPAFAHPHRDMGGLQRLCRHTGQVSRIASKSTALSAGFQSGRERGHGLAGIVSVFGASFIPVPRLKSKRRRGRQTTL